MKSKETAKGGIITFMKRLRTAFAVVLFAVFCAAAYGQSGRMKPTPTPEPEATPVRIVTEEVKVNILAFDDGGKFVNDVKPADLVITENNILHQASSVRRLPANVLIVM